MGVQHVSIYSEFCLNHHFNLKILTIKKFYMFQIYVITSIRPYLDYFNYKGLGRSGFFYAKLTYILFFSVFQIGSMAEIVYPQGCRPITDDLGPDELVRRLKVCLTFFLVFCLTGVLRT